jgi:hypothetical protein
MNPLVPIFRLVGSRQFGLSLLAVVWLFGSVILIDCAYHMRFMITNIDGIQYIRIAEHYFAGRFDDAINAYWSPMISWSILPFMAFGIGAQAAFYLAVSSWSIIGVAVGTLLIWKRTGGNLYASLAMEGVLLALYTTNLIGTTPDLLTVTWVLMYLWALLKVNDYVETGTTRQLVLWGAVLGVVMALGYFMKAFALPVFVVMGLGWLVTRLILARRPHETRTRKQLSASVLITSLAAVLALVIVAAPFVTAVSVKYGGFTIGSSFAVNTQHKGDPKVTQDELQNSLALPPPPNDHAISFGEDRTAQLYLDDGSVPEVERSTGERIAFYVTQRFPALALYLNKLTSFMPFGVPIVATFFLLIIFGILKPRRHVDAVMAATLGLVYFLGYFAIASGQSTGGNLRYFWPMLALSTAVACLLWPSVWRTLVERGHPWRSVIAALMLALIPTAAFTQMVLSEPAPFSTVRSNAGLGYLIEDPHPTRDQLFAEKLLATKVIEPDSKIVAGSGLIPNVRTLSYAFYMRVQIFGRRIPHDITDPRFQQVLRDNKIDYYFLYEPEEDTPLDVSSWGHIKKVYDMPYTCGHTATGAESNGCRLSIVAVDGD